MAKVKKSRKTKSKRKLIYIGDPNVYAVDCILSRRNRGRKTEYLVKWTGYSDCENSWVDKSDVTPDLIESYNIGLAFLQTQPLQEETGSVPVVNPGESVIENMTGCAESFFEEDLHSLGANIELLSATVDFPLFSTPDGTPTKSRKERKHMSSK